MGVPVPWGTCALDLVAYGERPKSVKWEFFELSLTLTTCLQLKDSSEWPRLETGRQTRLLFYNKPHPAKG